MDHSQLSEDNGTNRKKTTLGGERFCPVWTVTVVLILLQSWKHAVFSVRLGLVVLKVFALILVLVRQVMLEKKKFRTVSCGFIFFHIRKQPKI